MSRYYFHVYDDRLSEDTEGVELQNMEAAQSAAIHLSGRLMLDGKVELWRNRDWRMDVTDASGLIFFSLIFLAVDAPAGEAHKGTL